MLDSDTNTRYSTISRYSDGAEMTLVMSDEFNLENRKFSKGSDLLFEAVHKPDHTNEAIQFCTLLCI